MRAVKVPITMCFAMASPSALLLSSIPSILHVRFTCPDRSRHTRYHPLTPVTERIYYTDPYATEFDATVVAIEPVAGDAGRHGVVLDRTAFYPTSGGQPFDTGTLGAARVVEVVDRRRRPRRPRGGGGDAGGPGARDESIGPAASSTCSSTPASTCCRPRSTACCKVRTVSFHLGTASSTIDLAREVTAGEIARAEREANRVVWEDRPVDDSIRRRRGSRGAAASQGVATRGRSEAD